MIYRTPFHPFDKYRISTPLIGYRQFGPSDLILGVFSDRYLICTYELLYEAHLISLVTLSGFYL